MILATLLLAAVQVAEPTSAPAAATPAVVAAVRVQGRVTAGDDQPVAGARVRVSAQRRPKGLDESVPSLAMTTTDDAGRFAVDLVGDLFLVRVEDEGFAPFTGRDIPQGATTSVRLRPGRAVAGEVVARATGRPLAGALVRGCDSGALTFGRDACALVHADEEGRFKLNHLPEGEVTLSAVAPAHAVSVPKAITVQPPPAAHEAVRLVLGPGARMAGRVVDDTGAPVAKAQVEARQFAGTLSMHEERSEQRPEGVTTDDQGAFVFEGLAAGAGWLVTATQRGTRTVEPLTLTVEAGSDRDDLLLRLPRATSFVFRLIDADRQPVGDARAVLYIRPEGAVQTFAGRDTSSAHAEREEGGEPGRYRAQAQVPGSGTFDVEIAPDGWRTTVRQGLRLVAGETYDLGAVNLVRGRAIKGTVRDATGGPIADAEVSVFRMRHQAQARTRSDAEGRFDLSGLGDEPTARIGVRAKGYVDADLERVEIEGPPLDVVLQPVGAVEGRVVLADGGAPKAWTVRVQPESTASMVARMRRQFIEPRQFEEASGEFRMGELEAGVYTIEVRAEGRAPGRKTGVQVVAGETARVGTIRLDEGLSVSGRVLAASGGTPVADAQVEAGPPQAGAFGLLETGRQEARSDGEGRFTVVGLAAGTTIVKASHPDYAPAESRVELVENQSSSETILRLTGGGRLTGTVRGRDGAPIVSERVMVSQGLMGGETPRIAISDTAGSFELTRLPAGTYQVARMPRGAMGMDMRFKTAVIRDGETTVLDLDDSDGIQVSGIVRRGGTPIASKGVMFVKSQAIGSAEGLRTARTDALGRYEVALDQPGKWAAIVNLDDSLMGMGSPVYIDVPEGPTASIDIDLPTLSISGSLRTAAGEVPREAGVIARRVAAPADDELATRGVQVDATGSWELAGLEAGTYDLSTVAEGYRPVTREGIAVNDAPVRGVDFVVEPGRMVVVKVVDGAGRGLSGAMVAASLPGSVELAGSGAQTDINGVARLTAPGDGPIEIVALAAGWAPARLQGVVLGPDAGEDDVITLVMDEGASIAVELVSPSGQPVVGAQLIATPVTPFLGWQFMAMMTPRPTTDATGRAVIERLAPGAYLVSVIGRADVGPATVQVAPRGQAAVRIEVGASGR